MLQWHVPLIAMASIPNLIIHQMDVKTAFLNGELDEEDFLSSRFYMKDIGEANVILVSTLMDTSKKLMPNNGQAVSQLEYSRVIGCLMYVMTCTRPYIAFAVGKLSRSQQNLVDHLTKGLDRGLVIKSAKGMGLKMCLEPAEKEDEVFTSQWLISLKSFVLLEEKAKGYHQGVIHQRIYPQWVNSLVSLFSIKPSACILFNELADGSGR
ncbi:zinc finger, CCHC-type containing protein [Tanacetum coccineum]